MSRTSQAALGLLVVILIIALASTPRKGVPTQPHTSLGLEG